MRVVDMNWMQLADYLRRDDRAVIPLGSTEQHAYLSLGTDALLAERVAVEAAEPLGVPVFPPLAVCRRERSDGLHDWDAAVRVGRPGCGHASITCGRRQEGGG